MFPHLTTRRLGTRGRWADTLTIYPDLCLRSLGHLSTVLSILCNVAPAQVPLPLLRPGGEGQLALLQPGHHQEGSLLPWVSGFTYCAPSVTAAAFSILTESNTVFAKHTTSAWAA